MQSILEFFRNYAVRQPVGGPRMRLGVVWFVFLLLALMAGSGAVTLLFALVAGIGGLQVAGTWRARKVGVHQLVAGGGAALLPLAAWLGLRAVGIALVLVVAAAVILGTATTVDKASFAADRLKVNLPVASATLRSGLFLGLAAAAVVQVHRIDPMALLYLMSAVCVYDSGDYLVGSGTRNRLVGPVAGVVGVIVVLLAMTAINPPPLTEDADVRTVGLVLAVACPLGQLLGSWILPSARAKAPALRRLDAWLVAAPACLVALWIVN